VLGKSSRREEIDAALVLALSGMRSNDREDLERRARR
jgi:hypothetical protein